MMELATLQEEVFSLPFAQRAALFDRLIASFDEQAAIDNAWGREIAHREKQLDLGETKLVSATQVFAEIRSKLQ